MNWRAKIFDVRAHSSVIVRREEHGAASTVSISAHPSAMPVGTPFKKTFFDDR